MMTATFNAKAARAKRPCPLWVDAFQRDTQHLAADEVGAYMLILMAMWTRESCDFPDDDRRLAQVARVSSRLWQSRIGPVVKAFFRSADGAVFSKRLREEAAYVEKEVQSQSDRKRGTYAKPTVTPDASGENDEKFGKPLKNKGQASSTDDPQKPPRRYPSQQPNNPTVEGGGDSAGASASPRPSPDFRARILGAMGIGLDGVVGPSRFIGSQADMAEAARWLSLPGMTEDIVVREISQVCAAKRDGPPTRFRYFTGSMERLSAELTAPPLQPADISQHRRPTHGQPSAARAFDTAINRLADGIAAGTVNIDTGSSDPWEYARRQGGG